MLKLSARVYLMAASVLSMLSGVGYGSSISYGSFIAQNVSFNNVIENSLTDNLPLFGMPTVVGNTLQFKPTSFTSYAEQEDLDMTDSQLDLTIKANGLNIIPRVLLRESGTYTLTGQGTLDTFASIDAPVWVKVLKVDGIAITPVVFQIDMVVSPSNEYALPDDIGSGTWNAEVLIDLTAALRAKGLLGFATEVRITWDNVLTTLSEPDTSALIVKDVAEVIVPEPTTLLITAVGALMALRRRVRR